jgi:hypothetical protein
MYTVFLFLVNRLFLLHNIYFVLLISNIAFILFTSACCILSGKKVSQNNFPFFQRYLVFDLFFAFSYSYSSSDP